MEEPSFQPIITLYDAVTDSPVFRSSVYRYDQQLEHLEHWLDSLARHLRLYAEKLNKFNAETLTVCQKAIPEGLDETLIGPPTPERTRPTSALKAAGMTTGEQESDVNTASTGDDNTAPTETRAGATDTTVAAGFTATAITTGEYLAFRHIKQLLMITA
ncbi:hypothetical protein [Parasitella parasitica]|uniref:Uncharacterized protein n=1 Tax=Parasitella parasitica TaxID=35722 RepID=A0A0B7NGP4_9FUNG|nr:hypothetical protein [Parasitella parasitica]